MQPNAPGSHADLELADRRWIESILALLWGLLHLRAITELPLCGIWLPGRQATPDAIMDRPTQTRMRPGPRGGPSQLGPFDPARPILAPHLVTVMDGMSSSISRVPTKVNATHDHNRRQEYARIGPGLSVMAQRRAVSELHRVRLWSATTASRRPGVIHFGRAHQAASRSRSRAISHRACYHSHPSVRLRRRVFSVLAHDQAHGPSGRRGCSVTAVQSGPFGF